jgi:hypothetical protein
MIYNGKYSLKQTLLEDVSDDLRQGEWIDVPLSSIPEQNLQRLWDNYSQTYTKHGLDLSVSGAEGLRSYTGVFLVDNDTPPDGLSDAFIIYKQKGSFGKKLSLLGTCQGKELCLNLREAKSAVVNKMFDLLEQPGYFLEAGEAIESILSNAKPHLAFGETPAEKTVIEALNGRKFVRWIEPGEPLLDGKIVPEGATSYYWRTLKALPDKQVSKRIYGKPNG